MTLGVSIYDISLPLAGFARASRSSQRVIRPKSESQTRTVCASIEARSGAALAESQRTVRGPLLHLIARNAADTRGAAAMISQHPQNKRRNPHPTVQCPLGSLHTYSASMLTQRPCLLSVFVFILIPGLALVAAEAVLLDALAFVRGLRAHSHAHRHATLLYCRLC